MSELTPYTIADILGLQNLYSETVLFAKSVGDIDWPYPFPKDLLEYYIQKNELYGLRQEERIVSSVRLYERLEQPKALYIGKLATAGTVKGTNFFQTVFLPAIGDLASSRGRDELRLTCLASNSRLGEFYLNSGFEQDGEARPAVGDDGRSVFVKELRQKV